MKKFIITISVALLYFTLSLGVQASSPPAFILDNAETIARFEKGAQSIDIVAKDNVFTFSPKTHDPIISLSLDETETFDAEKYPYVALKMSVKSTVDVSGFFFGTSEFPGPQGDEFSQFDINKDGQMTDYVIYMSGYQHGRWKGTVNAFRLDPINASSIDDTAVITIDRLGFFASKKEADLFLKYGFDIPDDLPKDKPITPVSWVFSGNDHSLKNWTVAGGATSMELGLYKVSSNSRDCYIYKELSDSEKFEAENLKFVAYRYRAKNVAPNAGFFFTSSTITQLSDKSYTPFPIQGDYAWHDVIYDMSTAPHGNWNGEINQIRLDVSNPSMNDSIVFISRLGFFKTQEDAKQFLSESKETVDYTKSANFTASLQNAIIPAGSLSEGYDEKDYLLASSTPENKGTDPVVFFTDKSGKENVIALSNTTSLGYTKYVARKPGTYNIGYYHKDYNDISDHWGTEYINYVSNRKLFAGTSETEFSPDMAMTRGMFITVLGRMHGLDTTPYENDTSYSDVNKDEYYSPYINWSKEFALMAPLSSGKFAPEDPISRESMAAVLSNYINAYKYSFTTNGFSQDFTDVSGCSKETQDAINHVQLLGIINGKAEGLFDPLGISTRAEVSTVMYRLIKSILGVYYNTPYTSDYFSRDRIRIGTWGNINPAHFSEEYIKAYYDGGFDWLIAFGGVASGNTRNQLLNYAGKYGIEIYLADNAIANPLLTSAEYFDHPAFHGTYQTDEPGSDSFDKLAEAAKKYVELTNGKKVPYINLLPMYANAAQLKFGANAAAIEHYDSDPDLYKKYCQDFVDKMPVDYICTDIYPMQNTIYSEYIESINIIASVARNANKNFWCYFHGSNPDMPTKEFSWQIYSLLSFGCKGYLYWIWTPWAVDDDGKLTSNYYACQPVLLELRAISDIYVSYNNLGAFNHNYSTAVPYLNMSGQYKDFDTISEIKCDDPLLFGCFEKKEGMGKAFTVVNMNQPRGDKGATVKLKITGTTVTSYYGGKPTILLPENGYYTINLGVGQGAFVTVD